MDKKRIWELDALRGIMILCVVLFHGLFDLQYLIWDTPKPMPVLNFIGQYGGVLFVVLSGICVTLGSHSFRRGLSVFACGMGITAVTVITTVLGMTDDSIIIHFGVLHLLGVCMMLWPLLKKLPTAVLAVSGAVLVGLGFWFETFYVQAPWLFPFGLITQSFSSGDFFPLAPHLGWFLLGAVLGRTAYAKKASLLPKFPADAAVVRFFRFCGRQSLWIYLAHQPILFGIMYLVSL